MLRTCEVGIQHAHAADENGYFVTGFFRRLLDTRATAQNDQVSQRNLLATRLGAIECFLDALQSLEHFCQPRGLVDFPILLRRKPNASAVGSAAHVGAAESRG